MKIDEILLEIPHLCREDLKTIKNRVDGLLGFIPVPKPTPKETVHSQTFHKIEQLILLAAKQFVAIPSIKTIKETNTRQIGTKLEAICYQLEQLADDWDLGYNEISKLCFILVEAGIGKIEQIEYLSKSFTQLIYIITDVSSVLEESFPGYSKSLLFRKQVFKK